MPDAATDYIIGDFTAFTMSDDVIDLEERGLFDAPGPAWARAEELLAEIGVTIGWRSDWKDAERAVENLAEAASLIAAVVNAFKWQEINAAIERLKDADLTDPAAKATALREAVKLDAIKRGLTKRTRRDFEATSVKGEVGLD
ncbi:hypothetical protein [Methylopila sp. 73B]|uniref:hypothetical protein n=1 Tax=Methylopila sp. 73B TaxID=1120792 RepID=UPI000360DBEE|nr:hypothetical protein [Methylopila sp. 73B]